jgi:apolipoprotein N-acyltransferase
MTSSITIGLFVVGGAGLLWKTVHFVRVTIPENFGSNPGFGAYEVTVVPWWLLVSIGVGSLTSGWIGAVCMVLGSFALGFFAQLLARVFGGSGKAG